MDHLTIKPARKLFEDNRALGFLILVFGVLLSYFPALHNGFVWDDSSILLKNPAVTMPGNWASIWIHGETPDYFPLTFSILKIEWMLWDPWAPGFHGLNIALQLVGSLLLWRLLLELKIPGAWCAAALFALHPINVASVAWVSEIKNTLSLPLALGASLVFFSSCKANQRTKYDLTALALYSAALLSKTSLVTLPCVWAVLLWWRGEFQGVKSLRRIIPFLTASLAAGLLTLWFQTHHVIHHVFAAISPGLIPEIIRAFWAVGFYLHQLVWPASLSVLYDSSHPEHGLSVSWISLTLALLVTAVAIIWKRPPWSRGWLTAFSSFLILLLPVLGFLPMYYLRFSPVADQWLYVPAIPLFALTGAVTEGRLDLWRKGLFLLLLLCFGFMTWQRCGDLHDSESLWNSILLKNPASFSALQNLAIVYEERGEGVKALDFAGRAVIAHPDELEPILNFVAIQCNTGNPEEALKMTETALNRWRESPDLWALRGDILLNLSRPSDAISSYQQALSLNPHLVRAIVGLRKATSLPSQIP